MEIHNRLSNNSLLIEGETTRDVLQAVWESVDKYGKEYQGARGRFKSIKGVTLVIKNPLDEANNYPYWSKPNDEWYQNNFVRPQTTFLPEAHSLLNTDVYAYRYSDRSRYYDAGWGYVKGVFELLEKNNLYPESLEGLIKDTYQEYHPERILSVLAWQGVDLMENYQCSRMSLNVILERSRIDTLCSIVEELKRDPSSRRAITPSFTYPHIDHITGPFGSVPVYQNYQLVTQFNQSGEPEGLVSLHWHRAMDARGGTQLDISHDRDWGTIASEKLGLPLKQMVIFCSDLWCQLPGEETDSNLVKPTDIRKWLFSMTGAYDPKTEDIEKRLASPLYQAKIKAVKQKL